MTVAEQFEPVPEEGGHLRRLLEKSRAAKAVTGSELVRASTELIQVGVEPVEIIDEADTGPYELADGKLLVSTSDLKVTIGNNELTLVENQHRFLTFLGHPERIDREQGLKTIYNHVHNRPPETGIGDTERYSVRNLVYHLRTRIGIRELKHPKWGVIRRTDNGFKVVSSIQDRPAPED